MGLSNMARLIRSMPKAQKVVTLPFQSLSHSGRVR